jgi:hypothetical protein
MEGDHCQTGDHWLSGRNLSATFKSGELPGHMEEHFPGCRANYSSHLISRIPSTGGTFPSRDPHGTFFTNHETMFRKPPVSDM